MNTPKSSQLAFNLFLGSMLICTGFVYASENFTVVQLPNNVTVELPVNWTVLSKNQRISLDSWVKERSAQLNSDITSDLSFAANLYDDQDNISALFNIRYYPDIETTQAESGALSLSDIKGIDDAVKTQTEASYARSNLRILKWMGSTKQTINGINVLVIEYLREGAKGKGGSAYCVRLIKVLNASQSFTLTVSYREDQKSLLQPICDHITQSLKIK